MVGGTEGYKQARKILSERFGNAHLIAKSVITDLKNGKQVNSASELQQLANDLSTAAQTLKDLKIIGDVVRLPLVNVSEKTNSLIKELIASY